MASAVPDEADGMCNFCGDLPVAFVCSATACSRKRLCINCNTIWHGHPDRLRHSPRPVEVALPPQQQKLPDGRRKQRQNAWFCPHCTFENANKKPLWSADRLVCQMCARTSLASDLVGAGQAVDAPAPLLGAPPAAAALGRATHEEVLAAAMAMPAPEGVVACPSCTYINSDKAKNCAICQNELPKKSKSPQPKGLRNPKKAVDKRELKAEQEERDRQLAEAQLMSDDESEVADNRHRQQAAIHEAEVRTRVEEGRATGRAEQVRHDRDRAEARSRVEEKRPRKDAGGPASLDGAASRPAAARSNAELQSLPIVEAEQAREYRARLHQTEMERQRAEKMALEEAQKRLQAEAQLRQTEEKNAAMQARLLEEERQRIAAVKRMEMEAREKELLQAVVQKQERAERERKRREREAMMEEQLRLQREAEEQLRLQKEAEERKRLRRQEAERKQMEREAERIRHEREEAERVTRERDEEEQRRRRARERRDRQLAEERRREAEEEEWRRKAEEEERRRKAEEEEWLREERDNKERLQQERDNKERLRQELDNKERLRQERDNKELLRLETEAIAKAEERRQTLNARAEQERQVLAREEAERKRLEREELRAGLNRRPEGVFTRLEYRKNGPHLDVREFDTEEMTQNGLYGPEGEHRPSRPAVERAGSLRNGGRTYFNDARLTNQRPGADSHAAQQYSAQDSSSVLSARHQMPSHSLPDATEQNWTSDDSDDDTQEAGDPVVKSKRVVGRQGASGARAKKNVVSGPPCAHCGKTRSGNIATARFECFFCHKFTCKDCGRPWEEVHTGLTCQEYERLLGRGASAKPNRPLHPASARAAPVAASSRPGAAAPITCPRCHVTVKRASGSNSASCKNCGNHMF